MALTANIEYQVETLRRLLVAVASEEAMPPKKMFRSMAKRLNGFDAPTVWDEITPLAIKYKSENLGQGFPDWESPEFVKNAMCNSVRSNFNQYCRSRGDIALVTALGKHYSPLIGRDLDPLNEITISVGATEGLFAIMQSYLNPGDEVVTFEPAFDIYPAQVQMAGGVTKFVPLRLDEQNLIWKFDAEELERTITPNTKILLINSPHNPTGKVFNHEEILQIVDIVNRHPQLTVVMDEVYEKLVYDGKSHLRFCSYPGMWDRTLTVSSAGKTFSCTGWKVGWIYGPAPLINPIMLANQWVQFSVSTPAQRAMVEILEVAEQPYGGCESYYEYLRQMYEGKRNHLVETLRSVGLTPVVPQGGFFAMANTSQIRFPDQFLEQPLPNGSSATRDWGFARWLTIEVGVTPIPPTSFYSQDTRHLGENLARFAFCKTDECLVAARKKLYQHFLPSSSS